MVVAIDGNQEMIELVARPLRNLVKLMLTNTEECAHPPCHDACWTGMKTWFEVLKDMEGDKARQEMLTEAKSEMSKYFPAAPLTFQTFVDYMEADAEFWKKYWYTRGEGPDPESEQPST